jgi:glycosyltransferase involved in cell wall biosynthesis
VNTPEPLVPIPILHLITRLIVGGAQENTMYTAALLDKSQFKVQILSGRQTGSEGSIIEEIEELGISLVIFPDMLRQINPVKDLRCLWNLTQFIKKGNYQIVHTHSSKAGIIGRMAAWLAKTPIIIHTVHGWSFHDYMSPLNRQIYIQLERWMANFTDAFIAVTNQDIKKGLEAKIGRSEQYHLIRSSIPLDDFEPTTFDKQIIRDQLGIPNDKIVIGNVGRFSAQKNPLDWVRIAGQISNTCPNVFFLLVGDGPLRGEVEAEIFNQGIQAKTILTGLRRDVARMLSAMDIFLLTSLWEGLPRVIPQAMAMQIPIVANRADGTTEAVRDGISGFLCEPGDLEKASQYCVELVNNPIKRMEMGCMGRSIAFRDFDLRTMISEIEHLYMRLMTKMNL